MSEENKPTPAGEFIAGLTKERVALLERAIQRERDFDTAGRFVKWLLIVFGFVTGAIVAWNNLVGMFKAH